MRQLGINAVFNLISNFAFIFLVFKSLQALRLDYYVNQSKQRAFRLVLVLVSTALGFLVSQFFLNFIDSVRNLGYLL
ncbi:MAG TPA: DUF1146 family protein [Candidatus Ligilactobacillus excrementigallinarum]|uniref:DUF1146 family protein n=1 Tax=Candidatus Ligilactobacillus excrementigallinarum TaxID=2838641 RepID=A0A9D1UVY1_9LACO|nr:DUF1146 family protein [Candidatus Ligilactobacillus excrementigallinarum]